MLFDHLKFAFRSLWSNPSYSIAAILALGIGIGLNTAMFSVVDGILLKPLPFREPERLVQVRERVTSRGDNPIPLAPGNFYDYRDQAKTVELVAFRNSPFSLTSKDADPERYYGVEVTEGWFAFFGVKIVRGRDFGADDYKAGNQRGVIISHGLWRERFAGDPNIVGKEIQLNGLPQTVIGVAEEAFDYPGKARIWAPWAPQGNDRARRDFHQLIAFGRLKPGVPLERAQAEFAQMLAGMVARFPEFNATKQSVVTPLLDDFTGPVRPALYALLGAVGFVLAIACANVANLLLARGAARQQELSVRASLGASRGNLVGQLLTESFVLAALGGALGIALAYAAFGAFRVYAPKNLPRVDHVAMDSRVLLFALSKIDLHTSLKEKAKGSSGKTMFRNGLVVAQVAAAMILMTGAGLLIRSLYSLTKVDIGFEASHLITMRVTPLPAKYADREEKQIQLGRDIVAKLKTLPGLENAGVSTDLPLQGNPRFIMRIEGKPPVTVASAPLADYFTVSPSFFETMRIPLRQGRKFQDGDHANSPQVVLVNEEFARVHFGGASPVGKRLEIGFSDPPAWREIVGVVANVKTQSLDKPTRVQVYGCYFQRPGIIPGVAPSISVIGRAKGEPEEMAQAMRRAILQVDNAQPVWNILTMQENVNMSLAKERFTLFLMAVFAGVAFLLAVIGLSGVMTYSVAQRTREIGIRMAVGARPVDVLLMIERQALVLVLTGVAIGALGSLAIARSISTLLYSTSPYDPATFVAMSLLFLFTALLSGLWPARRAAAIDPANTLRAD
jgi:putative ABC transport system permease protein